MGKKFNDRIAEVIRDQIFGATDGTISTLAVVAGVSGANVSNFIILIAGASAMLAEAISMGFSSYISSKVRKDILAAKRKFDGEKPFSEGVMFWLATMGGGFVSIIPFLFPALQHPLWFSIMLSMIFLFAIGAHAGNITKTPWLKKGLQTAAIGLVASVITYAVGYGFSLIK